MIDIIPLPKSIYETAKKNGNTVIHLEFSGGSDEGYLEVNLEGGTWDEDFEVEIRDWAYEAYAYNGGGDGTDFGDDVRYDIENNKVISTDWCMARVDSEEQEHPFKVDDGDDND